MLGAAPPDTRPLDSVQNLCDLLARGQVVALTGAGVSTDSGIPDYRDEKGEWKRQPPIQYRDFVGSEPLRRRYWARSLLGFGRLRRAQPNPAHRALAALESGGMLRLTVTQNVDGLHQAAGARDVVDLHGRIDRVICLACQRRVDRDDVQEQLAELNPRWLSLAATIAPDGDADLEGADYSDFHVVSCSHCGGMLKPDVVFFGENVPRDRVDQSMLAVEDAKALLIVGSSLMVFSGFRFARAAQRRGIPIAIVNQGRTRADPFAALKIEGNAASVLTVVSAALSPTA